MSNNYDNIPTEYSTPPLNYPRVEEKNISLIRELSPQETLQEMMYQLEGKIWDKKTQNWIKIDGAKPLMNQEGRDTFFQYATAIISPIVTMSNYTKNYPIIHKIMRYQFKKANIHFHTYHKNYDLDITKADIVTSKLLILGLSAFYKAIGAGDRKAGTSHISESISTVLRPNAGGFDSRSQQSKKGVFSRLFGR